VTLSPDDKNRPRVFSVLKTLGGCGGTIVSRSLAACGALVLSEVNPNTAKIFGGKLNPINQLVSDNPILLPVAWNVSDADNLSECPVFGSFLSDLIDALDRPLVVRDYSYIDYIGVPFLVPAPLTSSLDVALRPFGRVDAVVLLRHPAKSYASLLRHGPLSGVLTPELFVAGHLKFMEDNLECPRFFYESFLSDASEMERLCKALHVTFLKDWRDALRGAPRLTGNPDAVIATAIKPPEPTSIERVSAMLGKTPGYFKLLELTGYSHI